MKKSSIISISIGTLIVAVFTLLLVSKDSSSSETASVNNTQSSSSTASGSNSSEATPIGGGGSYTDYDEVKLAEASGENYLFFHAPWCIQCRSVEQGILAGPIPKDVNIFKVDFDSRQDLKQKYGVTLQTTFVKLDESGELADKYVAYSEPTFESVISNFINK